MKVWPCWGWGLCFYERITVPIPAWIQMLFSHEEPTALPRQICHVQGTGLDVRGDQVEGFGRLLREEIRSLGATVHHEQEPCYGAEVHARGDLVRVLEGPICFQAINRSQHHKPFILFR